MKTLLKSFRLPLDCVEFIEAEAAQANESQSQVITKSIRQLMNFEAQWARDLQKMAEDEAYRKEQIELAEEIYE